MYGKLQLFHHCLIFSMNIYLVNFLLIDYLLLIWRIIYICRSIIFTKICTPLILNGKLLEFIFVSICYFAPVTHRYTLFQ